ncbi:MAG: FAD:protein FMN transferase [Myxococcota bacterium]
MRREPRDGRPHPSIAASSVALVLSALLLGLLPGCLGGARRGAAGEERVALSDGWLAMGTFFEADLRLREDQVPVAKAWLAWARLELERLERVYSRHDPDSALSDLNRALATEATTETSAPIGPELETVLGESVSLWEATGGAFDVTVGPLVEVWRRAAEQGVWPSVEAIRSAKERVGSDRLRLDEPGRLAVTARRVRIDLDAIAKGAAVDHVVGSLLRDLPDVAALISFGQSTTVALGDPDGAGGWVVVVQSSRPGGGELARLKLRDRAVSVSSSVGSTSEIAGQTVSHILDPRTGATVEGTVEAVVIGSRALRTDAWSTGLLVLGAQRSSIRLVEKAGQDAFVYDSTGRSVFSDGWESYLATATDSSDVDGALEAAGVAPVAEDAPTAASSGAVLGRQAALRR